MNLEDKSVLFKDKGGQSLYRYKKARKTEMEEMAQNGGSDWNPNCPNVPCYPDQGMGMQPQMGFSQNQMGQMGQFGPMGQMGQMSQMGQMGQMGQMYPPPNPNCPMQPCYPGDQGMYPQLQEVGMYAPPSSPQSAMFPPIGQSMIPCSECNMMQMPSFGPQQAPCLMSPEGMNSQMLTPCEECGTLLAPQFKAEIMGSPSAPPDPPGNYQEIGATMGGNALTIRVHRDKNRIEQVE
jgi:hypothetical protein